MTLMPKNLVSVIIPVFNLENYLERCLNSLITQSYSNIEIIIVDDGSSDSSISIIENFLKKDSRIVLLKGKHGGTATARKLGIQYAHGDFLTFVDGDDWYDQDSIDTMVSPFLTSDCDIVVAQHRKVFLEKEVRYEYKEGYPFDTIDPISFIGIINETKDYTLWAKMFKKELFENIIFHDGIPIGQDGLVLKQAILKSSVIKSVNKIVYNYLYREGSAMRKSHYLINNLLFLKGNFDNLSFYSDKLYDKERDRLMVYLMNLGTYYLKMSNEEKQIYIHIWDDYVYPNNIHLEFSKHNPTKNYKFVKKYPKLNSFIQLTPVYVNILISKMIKKFKKSN